MSDTQVAKDKLLHDFNEVVSDTEQLLKSVASTGGEKAQALRASLEQNLKASREQLRQLQETALERTRATARATDEYVHVHPWQSIGIAAAFGAIVGILVGLLIGRR
jgi:ElaB/YqjD/DUF883 family membrane-anchored ribosome-binding protein